jgi:hypothetical protein
MAAPGEPIHATRRRLVVVGFRLARAGHWYNELLGYASAARNLGWTISILVPKSADKDMARSVPAHRKLDDLPFLSGDAASEFENDPARFVDQMAELTSLWGALEQERLRESDLVLFVHADPRLLVGIGTWLSRRAVEARPNVFFRFIGYEILDPASQPVPEVRLYAAAAHALGRLDGDKVHFLVNSLPVERALEATTMRRGFNMPLPKYLPPIGVIADRQPVDRKFIYLRLNPCSGSLVNNVSDIMRLVLRESPEAFFVYKFAWQLPPTGSAIARDLRDHVRIVPLEQTTEEYFQDMAQADIVALLYQSKPYQILTSGVAAEAAAYAKPIVGPAGSWIAEQIETGRAIGHVFGRPSVRSIASTLLKALADLPRLQTAALTIAETTRSAHSSQRYLERMSVLAESNADMRLRYVPGQDIDFSSALDSRYFMRTGWGDTETWGVRTVERSALLTIFPASVPEAGLVVNALVLPFLAKGKSRLTVDVSVNGAKIAQWDFNRRERYFGLGAWRQAKIPRHLCGAAEEPKELHIAFTMPEVASPGSPNLSSDSRACGLGLRKLSLRSIEGNGWRSIFQRKLVTLKTGRCEFKVTEEVPTAGPDTTIL